jgi:hypothetical protein
MLKEKINIEKREKIKKNLFKAGLIGAGIIGLTSFTKATNIFWRNETGDLTDLKNNNTVYQNMQLIETDNNLTINIEPNKTIYLVTVTNDTTFDFNLDNLDLTSKPVTWELWVRPTSTDIVISFPSIETVNYINDIDLTIETANQIIYTT